MNKQLKEELVQALELARATIERLNPSHSSTTGTLYVIDNVLDKVKGKRK